MPDSTYTTAAAQDNLATLRQMQRESLATIAAEKPLERDPVKGIGRGILEALADNTPAGRVLLAPMDTQKEKLDRTLASRQEVRNRLAAASVGLANESELMRLEKAAQTNPMDVQEAKWELAAKDATRWEGITHNGLRSSVQGMLGPDNPITPAQEKEFDSLPETRDLVTLHTAMAMSKFHPDQVAKYLEGRGFPAKLENGVLQVDANRSGLYVPMDEKNFAQTYEQKNREAIQAAKDWHWFDLAKKDWSKADPANAVAAIPGLSAAERKAAVADLEASVADEPTSAKTINTVLNGMLMVKNDTNMAPEKKAQAEAFIAGKLMPQLGWTVEPLPNAPGTPVGDLMYKVAGKPMSFDQVLGELAKLDTIGPKIAERSLELAAEAETRRSLALEKADIDIKAKKQKLDRDQRKADLDEVLRLAKAGGKTQQQIIADAKNALTEAGVLPSAEDYQDQLAFQVNRISKEVNAGKGVTPTTSLKEKAAGSPLIFLYK